MVKPGGTGRPRLAISARLAPLPPSRSRMLALPSALPSPKVKTHLRDLAVSAAGFVAAGFGAALAVLNGLRALAGAAGLMGADSFDFAAAFFVFGAALAMAFRVSASGVEVAPYTTFCRFHARCGNPVSALHLQHLEQAETRQTDKNQIDRDHEIEEARHDQDEDAS